MNGCDTERPCECCESTNNIWRGEDHTSWCVDVNRDSCRLPWEDSDDLNRNRALGIEIRV